MENIKKVILSFLLVAGVVGLASTTGFAGDLMNSFLRTTAGEEITTIKCDESVTSSSTYVNTTYTHSGNSEFKLEFDHVKAGGGVGTILKGSYVRRTVDTKNLKSITVIFQVSEC